jgi:hypothetical protein
MLFKNSVRTSKRTPHFTITKINCLTLFKFNETIGYKNGGGFLDQLGGCMLLGFWRTPPHGVSERNKAMLTES